MHYDILAPVVNELSSLLTGARVERVLQGEDGGLYLLLRKERKNFTLLVSAERSLPRLHLSSKKPRSAPDPHPLLLNLRSRLPGGRLTSLSLLNDDRVVEFHFKKNDHEHHLFFELTGQSANLFLTDAGLHILSSYHTVPETGRARRLLAPGACYEPPQKKNRGETTPDIRAFVHGPSPNQAAESYYDQIASRMRAAATKSGLHSSLAKSLKKTERRLAAVKADLEEARHADTYRQKGDLILANLHELQTGMKHVELTGYDGARVAVTLDPRYTPKQNAGAYFRRFKKAKAGLPVIEARLRRTEEEIAELRSRLGALDSAKDSESARTVVPFMRRPAPDKEAYRAGRRKAETGSGIKKVVYLGWEILFGTSAASNDELTMRLARPHDLWLHAEGLPGSHVLVRNPGKSEIPPDILRKAAELAALHSKGKTAGKVPVTFTFARFVSKPKGAKPGLVRLSRRETILVRPVDDSPSR